MTLADGIVKATEKAPPPPLDTHWRTPRALHVHSDVEFCHTNPEMTSPTVDVATVVCVGLEAWGSVPGLPTAMTVLPTAA